MIKKTLKVLLIIKYIIITQLLTIVYALSNDQIIDNSKDLIIEIQIKGNRKTKTHIILQEMVINKGDYVDINKIEISRQAIFDLELFKSVQTNLVDHKNGKILIITVKEKYYFLPLPKLGRSSDGDIFYGGELKLNNFLGLNQTFETLWQKKIIKDSYLNKEQIIDFKFNYPRVYGSGYEFELDVEHKQAEIEKTFNNLTGIYIGDFTHLNFEIGYWLKPKGPSKGWKVKSGILFDLKKYELKEGVPDLYFDNNIIGLSLSINYDEINHLDYNKKGIYFQYKSIWSIKSLGSYYNYNHHIFIFRYYYSLPCFNYTNLNFQWIMEYVSKNIFIDPFFKLGGSTSLRGYSRESVQGNMYNLFNIEYLAPIGFNSIRGVFFIDIGNSYFQLRNFDITDQKIGIGCGLRWKIKSLVRTDLRLDFAYGIKEDIMKIYIGANAMF